LRLNGISGAIEDFFEGSTILIIDVPPKLRGINKENFVSKIEILIPFIEKSTIKMFFSLVQLRFTGMIMIK
jgi:hypothetical protein